MSLTLMPSLLDRALAKTAITLWNKENIRQLISTTCLPLEDLQVSGVWLKVENKVKKCALRLPVPGHFQRQVIAFIKPIGLEILRWIKYHADKYMGICLPGIRELSWTQYGTVDYKNTAEMLIKDQSLDIVSCYKLACIFCLENDMLQLWEKLPEDCKILFCIEEEQGDAIHQRLIFFWTYIIQGAEAQMKYIIERRRGRRCSLYRYAFECAAGDGNNVAADFFLQKLTSMEKDECLVLFRNRTNNGYFRGDYNAVLYLFLSQIDEEQQTEMFEICRLDILLCFLEWPRQTLFLGILKRMLSFLYKYDFYTLLHRISRKMIDGYNDYNYQYLFREFLANIPESFKIPSLQETCGCDLLYRLFQSGDMQNIKLILKNATLSERNEFIFSGYGAATCIDLLDEGKWNLVEFLLSEFIASEADEMNLKEVVNKFLTEHTKSWEKNKNDLKKFLALLDDFISRNNKRKCVEEDDSVQLRHQPIVQNPKKRCTY